MIGRDLEGRTWTLPLSPQVWGYIRIPALTDGEWAKLFEILELFKPGLSLEEATPPPAARDEET